MAHCNAVLQMLSSLVAFIKMITTVIEKKIDVYYFT